MAVGDSYRVQMYCDGCEKISWNDILHLKKEGKVRICCHGCGYKKTVNQSADSEKEWASLKVRKSLGFSISGKVREKGK